MGFIHSLIIYDVVLWFPDFLPLLSFQVEPNATVIEIKNLFTKSRMYGACILVWLLPEHTYQSRPFIGFARCHFLTPTVGLALGGRERWKCWAACFMSKACLLTPSSCHFNNISPKLLLLCVFPVIENNFWRFWFWTSIFISVDFGERKLFAFTHVGLFLDLLYFRWCCKAAKQQQHTKYNKVTVKNRLFYFTCCGKWRNFLQSGISLLSETLRRQGQSMYIHSAEPNEAMCSFLSPFSLCRSSVVSSPAVSATGSQ